ncbi:electron transport complex subunit E [Clostridium sp. AM58-1XD]|uniref:electron transport complex subunit RsxE n=1 Tax=Clostridium sp. AM58-1XD TaxID=2292307 RepID=UPI000E4F7823|nr:electron transport complex subunit E [Clostridium sp. AM58-1XD]RGZ00966.1 electron transport complex subunit E [Clostridium sp. AM58-1XD]
MNKCTERIYNGIVKENPTFVLMLGMCPTLAVTTSAINGLGMGLSTTAVLVFSNLIIAALRNIIPDRVRIPAFIVIVASLVTIVQLLIQGFVPSLYASLGIYIPLIVVNCIILGRAESYASKNGAVLSAFDGIGMGLGFTVGLTCIGIVREFLGSGAFFGNGFIPEDFHISIFVLAPGAFFVLAGLTALQNKFKAPSATNGDAPKSELVCGGDCMHCSGLSCKANHEALEEVRREAEAKALAAKKAAAEKAAAAKAAAAKAAENKVQE